MRAKLLFLKDKFSCVCLILAKLNIRQFLLTKQVLHLTTWLLYKVF
jgi:hypothetical protein